MFKPIPVLTPRQDEKFWKRVDASGDCWEWIGVIDRGGYGTFSLGATTGSRLAHRVVWGVLAGYLSTDLEVDHLCFNRRCVNPDHLEPVTHEENQRRKRWNPWLNKTYRTRCPQGHAYDVENTRIRANGTRTCRACENQRARAKRKSDSAARVASGYQPPPNWRLKVTHCPKGHPYDDENTYRTPSGKGGRRCKACLRERSAVWVSKKICSDPECDRSVKARGMCLMHYKRERKRIA